MLLSPHILEQNGTRCYCEQVIRHWSLEEGKKFPLTNKLDVDGLLKEFENGEVEDISQNLPSNEGGEEMSIDPILTVLKIHLALEYLKIFPHYEEERPKGEGIPVDICVLPDFVVDFDPNVLEKKRGCLSKFKEAWISDVGGRAGRVARDMTMLRDLNDGTFKIHFISKTSKVGMAVMEKRLREQIKEEDSHPLDLSLINTCRQTRWALVKQEDPQKDPIVSFVSSPSYGENDLAIEDIESNLYDLKVILKNSKIIAMMSIKPPNFQELFEEAIIKEDIKGRIFIDTTRCHIDIEDEDRVVKESERCIKRFTDTIQTLGPNKKSKIEVIAFGEDELKAFGKFLKISNLSDLPTLAKEVRKKLGVPIFLYTKDYVMIIPDGKDILLPLPTSLNIEAPDSKESLKTGLILAMATREALSELKKSNSSLPSFFRDISDVDCFLYGVLLSAAWGEASKGTTTPFHPNKKGLLEYACKKIEFTPTTLPNAVTVSQIIRNRPLEPFKKDEIYKYCNKILNNRGSLPEERLLAIELFGYYCQREETVKILTEKINLFKISTDNRAKKGILSLNEENNLLEATSAINSLKRIFRGCPLKPILDKGEGESQLRYILFVDLDSTLLDSKKALDLSLRYALRALLKIKYLFNLQWGKYKQYLVDGSVCNELRSAFEEKNESLSHGAEITKIDERHWEIRDSDRTYEIKAKEKELNIYIKELSLEGIKKYCRKYEELVYDEWRIYKEIGFGDFRQEWNNPYSYAVFLATLKYKDDEAFIESLKNVMEEITNTKDKDERDEKISKFINENYILKLIKEIFEEETDAIATAREAFWKPRYEPYKEAKEFLQCVKDIGGVELYIVSEGHPATQWKKIQQMGLEDIFPQQKVLTTGSAGNPVKDIKDIETLIDQKKDEIKNEEMKLTKIKGTIDGAKESANKLRDTEKSEPYASIIEIYRRSLEKDERNPQKEKIEGLEKDEKRLKYMESMFDKFKEKRWEPFYSIVTYAVLDKPETPLRFLKSFDSIQSVQIGGGKIGASTKVKLAIIGDRQKNDITPLTGLFGKDVITIRFLTEKYAKGENPSGVKEEGKPKYLVETLTQAKDILLRNETWNEVKPIDYPIILQEKMLNNEVLNTVIWNTVVWAHYPEIKKAAPIINILGDQIVKENAVGEEAQKIVEKIEAVLNEIEDRKNNWKDYEAILEIFMTMGSVAKKEEIKKKIGAVLESHLLKMSKEEEAYPSDSDIDGIQASIINTLSRMKLWAIIIEIKEKVTTKEITFANKAQTALEDAIKEMG